MSLIDTCTDGRGVSTVSLNREPQRNALDLHMINELTSTIKQLTNNTRVLVLTGKGRHFCAGADVNWMKASASLSADDNKQDALALAQLLNTLNHFPHPTVARVQGAAIGGGVGLISCCDIVVAENNSQFSLSEVKLGLIPATISPYVLQAISVRAARRYFITAERFDAAEAHRIGLVHELCDIQSLDKNVEHIVSELLKAGPDAQSSAKQLINTVAYQTIDINQMEKLAELLASIRAGQEAQEGLAAFLEKRAPRWTDS